MGAVPKVWGSLHLKDVRKAFQITGTLWNCAASGIRLRDLSNLPGFHMWVSREIGQSELEDTYNII